MKCCPSRPTLSAEVERRPTGTLFLGGEVMNRCLMIAAACLAALPMSARAQAPPSVVRLKAQASVTGAEVRLSDIAEISDQDRRRHMQLGELDLHHLLPGEQETIVDKAFVRVRILLAGFDPETVAVTGADRIRVVQMDPARLTDLGIEEAALRTLAQHYHVPTDDLQVRLLQPLIGPWLSDKEDLANVRAEVAPPVGLPLGKVPLTVRMFVGERLIASRQAGFEVTRKQTVVVPTASLDRGHTLTPKHLREETRFVDNAVDLLAIEDVTGRRLAQRVGPGEVLSLRHLAVDQPEERMNLVEARDSVRLVVRQNGLTVVVPGAEALQAGAEGQVIRVKNLQTNRVVTGRVVARGEVEVPLR